MTEIQTIIQELEQQRAAVDSAIAALRGLVTAAPQRRGPGRPPGKRRPGRPSTKRRHISEEGRRRIAEAQRQRWAQKKASKKTARKATNKNAAGRKAAA